MIVSAILYATMAGLAVMDISVRRGPRPKAAPLGLSLMETGVILALAETQGWEAGLTGFVVLLVILEGHRFVTARPWKRSRPQGPAA